MRQKYDTNINRARSWRTRARHDYTTCRTGCSHSHRASELQVAAQVLKFFAGSYILCRGLVQGLGTFQERRAETPRPCVFCESRREREQVAQRDFGTNIFGVFGPPESRACFEFGEYSFFGNE